MDMKKNHFVGRSDAIERLHGVLSGRESAEGPLTVQSIEGPGGIGKTYLFDHALSGIDLTNRNYVTLRIDGNCLYNTKELTQAVKHLICNTKAIAIRNSNKRVQYYFPRVDHVLKAIERIRNEAAEEFKKLNPNNQEGLDIFLELLDKSFQMGKNINEFIPIIPKGLNVKDLEMYYKIIKATIPLMKSLSTEGKKLIEMLGVFSDSRALRNAIKENACRPLSDALVSDLSAILAGYRKKDFLRATHRKVEGIDRLLLIVDDYEMLQAPLGEFLVSSFLPALRTVNFQTVVIIMGRDQLVATHTSWDQYLKSNMLKRIDLAPLSRPEMDQLVESYGVSTDTEKDRAWNDTQGYPFYVQLWAEEIESGGRTASMLKRFHDRTTRWMSSREKEWLKFTLFIDKVNISTLRHMFGNEQEAKEAFKWFECEGSVRDPYGESFCVREYIRSRLIDYLRESDPGYYLELQKKGQLAMNALAALG